MHRFLAIANYLLIAAIIAIIAAISSETLSRRLIPAAAPKSAAEKTAAPSPQSKSLDYYAPILTQGLFGSATKGTLSAIVNAPAGQTAMPVTAPSELLLLGTATGSHRETFALVRHTTKNEERVFRLGDSVFDAGRLVQVTREQAFIVINGKKVELLTPMTPPSGKPAGLPVATSHTVPVAVASQGGNSFVIDQRALNAALDNPAQAMSDARLLPSQKDGKVEGFRASEVKPQGVFGMIGIKNGDIIKSLNDYPMDSPDKALQSFIALKGQNRLKMDIIRDGQPQTLTYDIR
jgi:general secretion pathway protein C